MVEGGFVGRPDSTSIQTTQEGPSEEKATPIPPEEIVDSGTKGRLPRPEKKEKEVEAR